MLLRTHSLNILRSKDRIVIDHVLLGPDVRLSVSVKLLGLGCEVEVDGERPSEEDWRVLAIENRQIWAWRRTKDKRNAHGVPRANFVGDVAEDDRDDGSTAD